MMILKTVLASLSVAAGVMGTLMFIVFLMAGSANSKPDELRRIIQWMWGIAGVGVLCLSAGIWLICIGRPLTGGLIGGFPLAAMVICMIVLTIMSI